MARAGPHGKWELVGIPVKVILAHPEPLGAFGDRRVGGAAAIDLDFAVASGECRYTDAGAD